MPCGCSPEALTACSLGKTKLADVLPDPPEHMIDSFVDTVNYTASLDSLFAIFCAKLIKVKVLTCIASQSLLAMLNKLRPTATQLDMSKLDFGSRYLDEALNQYIREAAVTYGRPLTDSGSAWYVRRELTTKCMGCPALLLFAEFQVSTRGLT